MLCNTCKFYFHPSRPLDSFTSGVALYLNLLLCDWGCMVFVHILDCSNPCVNAKLFACCRKCWSLSVGVRFWLHFRFLCSLWDLFECMYSIGGLNMCFTFFVHSMLRGSVVGVSSVCLNYEGALGSVSSLHVFESLESMCLSLPRIYIS